MKCGRCTPLFAKKRKPTANNPAQAANTTKMKITVRLTSCIWARERSFSSGVVIMVSQARERTESAKTSQVRMDWVDGATRPRKMNQTTAAARREKISRCRASCFAIQFIVVAVKCEAVIAYRVNLATKSAVIPSEVEGPR